MEGLTAMAEVKSVVLTAGPTVRAVAKVLHVPLGQRKPFYTAPPVQVRKHTPTSARCHPQPSPGTMYRAQEGLGKPVHRKR